MQYETFTRGEGTICQSPVIVVTMALDIEASPQDRALLDAEHGLPAEDFCGQRIFTLYPAQTTPHLEPTHCEITELIQWG